MNKDPIILRGLQEKFIFRETTNGYKRIHELFNLCENHNNKTIKQYVSLIMTIFTTEINVIKVTVDFISLSSK